MTLIEIITKLLAILQKEQPIPNHSKLLFQVMGIMWLYLVLRKGKTRKINTMGTMRLGLGPVVSMETNKKIKSVMMATLKLEMDATLSASWSVEME